MSTLSDRLVKKLGKVAQIIDAENQLYFLGLVHHDHLPPNRWDVLVSAKKLVPWSVEAIEYVARLLKKELTNQEFVQVARVVVLPRNNQLIASLDADGQCPPGTVG
jgi:hypothetical protein